MLTNESERSHVGGYDKAYDIGNKGYLTKFERQLKELDDDVEIFGVEEDDFLVSLQAEEFISQQRRFSTNSIVFGNRQNDNFHDEVDPEDPVDNDPLNMDLSESERNYQNYHAKVQQEFKEADLKREEKEGNVAVGIFRTQNKTRTRGDRYHTTDHSSSYAQATAVTSTKAAASQFSKCVFVFGVLVFYVIFALAAFFSLWKKATIPFGLNIDNLSETLSDTMDHSASIASLGRDMSVELLLNHGGKEDQSSPYACLNIEEAVYLWRATKNGMVPNVVLVENLGSNGAGTNDNSRSEYGLKLAFQGATRNHTHACLPVLNEHRALCIDLVSNRCDEPHDGLFAEDVPVVHGSPEDEEASDSEAGELYHVFLGLLKESSSTLTAGSPRHNQRSNECGYLHQSAWCSRRVSIVVVGEMWLQ